MTESGGAQGIAALERRVAALEARVRLGPVGVAPELEAERFLSAGQYAAATVPLQRAIQLGQLGE